MFSIYVYLQPYEIHAFVFTPMRLFMQKICHRINALVIFSFLAILFIEIDIVLSM